MDFLCHVNGVWVSIRFSAFLLYRNCKRLREFDKIEISSKAVEVTVNNKEENSEDFCLDFVQEGGGGAESCWRPYSAVLLLSVCDEILNLQIACLPQD